MKIDEHYLNRPIPHQQQQTSKMKPAGYIILYSLLGFVILIVVLSFLMWLIERRRAAKALKESDESYNEKRQIMKSPKPSSRKDAKDGRLYQNLSAENIGIEEKISLREGSIVTTTTTEIQPKAPPISCEKIDEMSRRSGCFGMMNIYHQQKRHSSTTSEFGMPQHFPGTHASSASSSVTTNPSVSSTGKRMSRLESFPYEEYGIPVEERQPIKTRVQDLKTYDTYFHLTPIDPDLLREDSIAEDDHSSEGSGNDENEGRELMKGRFESRSTLPRTSIDQSQTPSGP